MRASRLYCGARVLVADARGAAQLVSLGRDNIPMRFKRYMISGEAVVVAFDICSSSDMLEELILRNDIGPYTYVIRELKHHLAEAQNSVALRYFFGRAPVAASRLQ
jgi:hypothetical protein